MERSEIRITVGGEDCIERGSDEDDANTTVGARATIQCSMLSHFTLFSMSVLLQMNFLMMLQLW